MTDGAPDMSAQTDLRPRRLRRRPDFLAAAAGRRFHTERMTAQARLREPDERRDGAAADGLYVGFTITKRVGHATERNRIRRRLRRAVERASGDAAGTRADVVVVARRPALDAPFLTLVEDLRRALSVVTKPRMAKHDDAASGAGGRDGAHVRRRGKCRAQSTDSRQKAPHGSTDG